jgi:hypothetical protein
MAKHWETVRAHQILSRDLCLDPHIIAHDPKTAYGCKNTSYDTGLAAPFDQFVRILKLQTTSIISAELRRVFEGAMGENCVRTSLTYINSHEKAQSTVPFLPSRGENRVAPWQNPFLESKSFTLPSLGRVLA